MERSFPPGALVSDRETERSHIASDRAWTWLRVAIAFVFAGTTLRYFAGNRLHTPLGHFWGMADDVYVSADFARTFAEGNGLLWYPDAPRVEGFSNPLWVLVIAGLHRLPGFDENRLGLYVGIVNLCVMAALGAFTVSALQRVPGVRTPTVGRGLLLAVLAFFACLSLCVCAGAGFETGAVCLFAMAALSEALAPVVRPLRVAALVALAFWTRIDAVLACLPALLFALSRVRQRRELTVAAVTLFALCGAQFVLRRWYYGDWLPNTYYLKSTGWPLADRLNQGLLLYRRVLFVALFAVAAFVALRRRLGAAQWVVGAALGTHIVTIAYAMNNGSDLLYVYGFDRYCAVGTSFLAFALGAAVLALRLPRLPGIAAALVGFAAVLGPLLLPDPLEGLDALSKFFDLRHRVFPRDTPLEIWVHQGKLIGEVTRPGARVALCPAGALVYFSHRGGVDLLGKVEPLVAHSAATATPPPEARCWRGFPGGGHNKEDTPAVFAARKPDLSLVAPPKAEARRYLRFRHADFEFFVRKKSPYLLWSEGTVVR